MEKTPHDDASSVPPSLNTAFYISGRDFDPEDCTRHIGLSPTEVSRPKNQYVLNNLDFPNLAWMIERRNRNIYSVSEAVAEVLDAVWPARDKIIAYVMKENLTLGVSCNVTIHEDRPVYELEPDVIKKLAYLGCEFGLDIFDYSKDDDEDDLEESAPSH